MKKTQVTLTIIAGLMLAPASATIMTTDVFDSAGYGSSGHESNIYGVQHTRETGTGNKTYTRDFDDSFNLAKFDQSLGTLVGASLSWRFNSNFASSGYVWDVLSSYTPISSAQKKINMTADGSNLFEFEGMQLANGAFSSTNNCTSSAKLDRGRYYDNCDNFKRSDWSNSNQGGQIDLLSMFSIDELLLSDTNELFSFKVSGESEVNVRCNMKGVQYDYCGASFQNNAYGFARITYSYQQALVSQVPEPSAMVLFFAGILGLFLRKSLKTKS